MTQDIKIKEIINKYNARFHSNKEPIVWARDYIVFRLRQLGYSQQEVAQYVDHERSNVSLQCKRILERKKKYPIKYRRYVTDVKNDIDDAELENKFIEQEEEEDVFDILMKKMNEVNTHSADKCRDEFVQFKRWSNENINPKNLKS